MNLTMPIHKALRERPNAIATISGGRRQTFRQYAERISRLAGAFKQLGVAAGDRIAMLAFNSDRYMESIYATWWAGAVISPLNVRWSLAELVDGLTDSGATVLLVGGDFRYLVQSLRASVPSLRTVVCFDPQDTTPGMQGIETLICSSGGIADAARSGDDLAALVYTGGTTGRSKGVMVTHANWYINSVAAIAAAPRPSESIGLVAAPLFHAGGVVYMTQLAVHLGTQITISSFDPATVLDLIETERVSETFIVPTMLKSLLDTPGFATRDLGSLRCIIYGAAPMDESLLDRAMAALPEVDFIQCYGMSECGTISALPAHWHTMRGREAGKLSSAGKVTSCFATRIVDEQGADVAPLQVGELLVRGPSVMRGYWNKPAETNAALNDGWLRTGDGAFMDEDGFLHVADRLKDMIISGGENVFSNEVENVLLKHPAVAMCAVIGVPDAHWGERVHAIVVAQQGFEFDEAAVLRHCRGLIAHYKCPRTFELRPALPVSAAGKILKGELREPFWRSKGKAI